MDLLYGTKINVLISWENKISYLQKFESSVNFWHVFKKKRKKKISKISVLSHIVRYLGTIKLKLIVNEIHLINVEYVMTVFIHPWKRYNI